MSQHSFLVLTANTPHLGETSIRLHMVPWSTEEIVRQRDKLQDQVAHVESISGWERFSALDDLTEVTIPGDVLRQSILTFSIVDADMFKNPHDD